MIMNTEVKEDYISFELAKLLKEKGYKGSFNGYYTNVGCVVDKPNTLLKELKYQYYERVSLYMAMKWLREVHKLYIDIWADAKDSENNNFNIIFRAQVYNGPSNYGTYEFSTYEEAAEASIKFCLENLI